MLHFTEKKAEFVKYNPRAEKHGTENEPAGDIRLEIKLASSVLNDFRPGLQGLLFCKAGPGDQIDLIEGEEGLVALALPRIKPLVWDEDFPGYELEITEGRGLKDPLFFADVNLTNFVIEPIEGGSVSITFSAQCHPNAMEAGLLCHLMKETVTLTLTPPSAQQQEQAQADLDKAA